MRNRFQLEEIKGKIEIQNIAFTVVDGVKEIVEYQMVLSQGVNNEWRNIFLREWDKETTKMMECPESIRNMELPSVNPGTTYLPGVITFRCMKNMFSEVASLVRECIENATDSYLTTLGIPQNKPTDSHVAIESDIKEFMENLNEEQNIEMDSSSEDQLPDIDFEIEEINESEESEE
jgi:hypothetical protein